MSVTSIAKKTANSEIPKMTSPSGATYTIETVTPEKADEWLARNTDNRNMSKNVVARYARDMRTGDWLENGSAISFGEDGTLLNGQHRLAAVVQSNRSIIALVVRNLPSKSQDTMDDLKKRSLADTFGFHGFKNATSAAAITRRVLLWQNGIRTNNGSYQPTKAESLDIMRTDHTLAVAIDAAAAMSKRNLVSPSIVGLTWWLFWNIDENECSEFWSSLHTGANLETDSPIYMVREQIISAKAKAERVPETAFLAYIIQAWNHWRAGKTLASTYRYQLKANARFPEPK